VAAAGVQRAGAAGRAPPAATEEAARPAAAQAKAGAVERAGPVPVQEAAEPQAVQAREETQGAQVRAARQVAEARALPAQQAQDQAALAVQADPEAALVLLALLAPREPPAKVTLPALPDQSTPGAEEAVCPMQPSTYETMLHPALAAATPICPQFAIAR
jgi:hypothetical protein